MCWQANVQPAPWTSQPGSALSGMMGLVPGLPVTQALVATTQVVPSIVMPTAVRSKSGVLVSADSGAENSSASNMPSRLPQPGLVPASNKS